MDNCLTFALRMARYGRTDHYMLVRKSHWGWFPHVAVMFELTNGDMVRYEYIPIGPRPRWIPPLFFKGEVKVTYYKRENDGYPSNRDRRGRPPVSPGHEQGRGCQANGAGKEEGRQVTGKGQCRQCED